MEGMPMRLSDILDEIIIKEVYKKVPVDSELLYSPSLIPDEDVERMQTDGNFKKKYLEKLSKRFRKLGYRDLKVIDIDPSSQSLVVRYTGYYSGCRQYPEVHLKTLLILHDAMGWDIHDPKAFAEIVEKTRKDLGRRNIKVKEARVNRFAKLFKRAIDAKFD
jgi:hypothetical protein